MFVVFIAIISRQISLPISEPRKLVYRQTNRGIKVEIIIEAMTLSFSFDECQLFGKEIAIDRMS